MILHTPTAMIFVLVKIGVQKFEGESFQKRIRRSWTTLTTLHDIITVMFPYSHDIPLTPTIFPWNSMIFSYSYNNPIKNPIISHHICHSPKKSLIIRFIGFHFGRFFYEIFLDLTTFSALGPPSAKSTELIHAALRSMAVAPAAFHPWNHFWSGKWWINV